MQAYKFEVNCNPSYGIIETTPFNFSGFSKNSDLIIYKIFIPKYESLVDDLSNFLDSYEVERAKRYYKKADKNRFIICRSLLKFALALYTQSHIKDISIELLSNKKPYLPKYPDVFFNVSHSGDYAVLAISDTPIGIDIESMDLNYPFQETMPSIFNEDEIQFIHASDHKAKTFFRLWTRKEAFVKALGKGIDDNFSKIPCLDGQHILDTSLIESLQNWQVHGFEIAKNYSGAIAYAAKEPIIKKPVCMSLPNNLTDLLKLSLPNKI
jgi:4'-phosphopantetheinyl transferase